MKYKILITCLICSISIFIGCQNGNSFFSQKRILSSELNESGGLLYYNGKPFTGISFEMWDEKITKIEIELKEGKISGTTKKYYADGTLQEVVELFDSKKNGKRIEYGENGKEKIVQNYLNDDLHGKYSQYYINGNLKMECTYQNGKKEGLLKNYFENGNIQLECTYKNGRREGILKEYYENGKVKEECIYLYNNGSPVNECMENFPKKPKIKNSKSNDIKYKGRYYNEERY